jgi:site-specific DNA recombinase
LSASRYSKKSRPQYQALIAAIEAGEIEVLVAWHIDRLYRRLKELEQLIDLAETNRLTIHTLNGEIDLTSGDGRANARLLVLIAEKQSDDAARRIQRKHRELAERGLPKGGPRSYGYERDGLRVIESEAQVICDVANRVLAGQSVYAIVKRLNDQGVSTAKGTRWTNHTLKGILTSPRIAGLRFHKGEEVAQAQWPPILDRELWERVNATLRRTSGTRSAPRHYLLTGGIATCGRCGSWLHAQVRHNGKPGYACLAEKGCCAKLTIDAARLDETVTEMVLQRMDSPRSALRALKDGKNDVSKDLETIQADEEKLGTLGQDYANGLINRTAFMSAQKTLAHRIHESRQRLATKQTRSSLAAYHAPGSLRYAWPDLSVDVRRSIISTILTVEVAPATRRGPIFDVSRVRPRSKV